MEAIMRAQRILGKTFLLMSALLPLTVFFSGCNFFGKLEDKLPVGGAGQLGNGVSIIGSWTTSASSIATDGRPNYAVTETYTFDPSGAARIELRDMLTGGITCSGFGQFRQPNEKDVVVYIQAVIPTNCAFPAQISLPKIGVSGDVLTFKDSQTNYEYRLFKEKQVQAVAPIGVWDFDSAGADANGEGGIDYLFLDPRGYFLLQTTSDGESYLLIGYYKIETGMLSLYFFANMDPANVTGDPIVYKQFVTDGVTLELVEDGPSGDIVSVGTRI